MVHRINLSRRYSTSIVFHVFRPHRLESRILQEALRSILCPDYMPVETRPYVHLDMLRNVLEVWHHHDFCNAHDLRFSGYYLLTDNRTRFFIVVTDSESHRCGLRVGSARWQISELRLQASSFRPQASGPVVGLNIGKNRTTG